MINLYSEFPQGANGDPGDRAIVVGWNNGALLGSTYTGHSLERDFKFNIKLKLTTYSLCTVTGVIKINEISSFNDCFILLFYLNRDHVKY